MSMPGARRRKAVAGQKGITAEGRRLRDLPGRTENIRAAVAFAESYVLIAGSLIFCGNGKDDSSRRVHLLLPLFIRS